MSVSNQVAQTVQNIASNAMDEIAKFLASNKEFLAGMGIGAALATPTGQALVKRLGKDAGQILSYAKTMGDKAFKDAISYAVNSRLGKTNVMSNALSGTGKAGKVARAATSASAIMAAGKILGSYLGYTISEKDAGKKAARIIFSPVYATADGIKGIVTDIKDKSKTKKEAKEQQRELQHAVGEVLQAGINDAARAQTDRLAAEMGMSKRPEHPLAQTEWKKEVERMANYKRGSNDPKWYKGGKYNCIGMAGEFNFDLKNSDFDHTPLLHNADSNNAYVRKPGMPSVGAVDLVLTLGKSTNDMLSNLYTDVTIKIKALNRNSSITTSWNKGDLVKLVHTMRLLYAGWCIGRRAYKLINEFEGKDLSQPYAYFAAMGLDYDSWRSARAQIREDLVNLSSMINTYLDWGKLDLFKRTEQLFDNAYRDGKSIKAQTVFFTMSSTSAYYDFAASQWKNALFEDHTVSLSTATGLSYVAWYDQFVAIVNSLVNVTKVQDMLSCLRFVYGSNTSGDLFKIPSPEERINFKWDAEVQAQIENAVIYHIDANTYAIADDAANQWFTESITISNAPDQTYINSHLSEMTKDEQIVATRLVIAQLDNVVYYGTEVARSLFIYNVMSNATSHIKNLSRNEYYNDIHLDMHVASNTSADKASITDKLIGVQLLNTFDWAPLIRYNIYVGTINTSAVYVNKENCILNADWENYAIICGNTVDSGLTLLSYLRNGNYGLHSILQSDINVILDKAKTA